MGFEFTLALNAFMSVWYTMYLDVVSNSTSNWSLNFVLLFILLYCVDVHIL